MGTSVLVVVSNSITPIDGSCYKLIDSSIQQEISASYSKY